MATEEPAHCLFHAGFRPPGLWTVFFPPTEKFLLRQDFKDIIETAATNFRPIVITPDQSLVPLFYQILIPTLRHVPFVSLYDKITVILNTMQLMDIKKPVSGKRILFLDSEQAFNHVQITFYILHVE